MSPIVMLAMAGWACSALAGRYVAMQKRRAAGEGLLFGAMFGPLGALIVACLPDDGMTAQQREWAGRDDEEEIEVPVRGLRRVTQR